MKLAKFQKFQAQLQKDFKKKNRPRAWEDVDDLEKQEREALESDN